MWKQASARVNQLDQNISTMRMLNAESNRKILINGDGIDGLAELVSTHDSADFDFEIDKDGIS